MNFVINRKGFAEKEEGEGNGRKKMNIIIKIKCSYKILLRVDKKPKELNSANLLIVKMLNC